MSPEEYLEHAEECERLATMANLAANKRALLESAQMFRMLAGKTRPRPGKPSGAVQGARPKPGTVAKPGQGDRGDRPR